jgi:hypothetical protein
VTVRGAGGWGSVRLVGLGSTAAVMLLASVGAAAAQQGSLAAAIQATFLAKFGGFVEWPSRLFASPHGPLTVCVAAPDPFGALLDEAASGEEAGDHPIRVRHLPEAASATGCQLLFAGGPSGAVAAALAAVAGRPVLTVTDLPQSAPAKGIINFVLRQGHVRFEIDNQAARAAGLKIDSQLLALALR